MKRVRMFTKEQKEAARRRWNKWAKPRRELLNKQMRDYRAQRYKEDRFWRDSGPKASELKAWLLKLKEKPCADCGNSFPACCMDFDHRPDEKKSYCIGTMFAHHYSRSLIERELNKCDLVCSNCHRIRTRNKRLGSGKIPAGSIIPKKTHGWHNSAKTHCPQGHPYSMENTYHNKGERSCRECQRERRNNARISKNRDALRTR